MISLQQNQGFPTSQQHHAIQQQQMYPQQQQTHFGTQLAPSTVQDMLNQLNASTQYLQAMPK